eukprot:11907029-Alexandrium_andersonii.AAC.1
MVRSPTRLVGLVSSLLVGMPLRCRVVGCVFRELRRARLVGRFVGSLRDHRAAGLRAAVPG